MTDKEVGKMLIMIKEDIFSITKIEDASSHIYLVKGTDNSNVNWSFERVTNQGVIKICRDDKLQMAFSYS